jgi:hypothetical protein
LSWLTKPTHQAIHQTMIRPIRPARLTGAIRRFRLIV